MQGYIRFVLFLAVVALIAGAFYTKGLRATIEQQETQISSLTIERDAAQTKADQSVKDVASKEVALKEAQAKVTELQTQIDAALAASKRGRR